MNAAIECLLMKRSDLFYAMKDAKSEFELMKSDDLLFDQCRQTIEIAEKQIDDLDRAITLLQLDEQKKEEIKRKQLALVLSEQKKICERKSRERRALDPKHLSEA